MARIVYLIGAVDVSEQYSPHGYVVVRYRSHDCSDKELAMVPVWQEKKKHFFKSRKKFKQFHQLWKELQDPFLLIWDSRTDNWKLPKKVYTAAEPTTGTFDFGFKP